MFDTEQYAQAESIFQTLYQQLEQTPSYDLCFTLINLGRCFDSQGKTADAINCYQQTLAIAQQLEPSTQLQVLGTLYTDLADAFRHDGDYAQAKKHYEQALTITKETGDIRQSAVTQGQLGALAHAQGDLQEAELNYQTNLKMFQSLNEPESVATGWHRLGNIYQEAQTWKKAEQAYRESARIQEALVHQTENP